MRRVRLGAAAVAIAAGSLYGVHPAAAAAAAPGGQIAGRVLSSLTCGPPPPAGIDCPIDNPLAGFTVLVKGGHHRHGRSATSADDGSYMLRVPAGTYLVTARGSSNWRCERVRVVVASAGTAHADITCSPIIEPP